MAELEVRPIDPRDTTWQIWNPTYRVVFWSRTLGGGWASREFDLTGATLSDAHAWATENASAEEMLVVFAVVELGGDTGAIRLLGDDPTREAAP